MGEPTRSRAARTMRDMRRTSHLSIALLALVAAACGTVSLETTTETDLGKVDVQEAPVVQPSAPVVETTVPEPLTDWSPNLPEGAVAPDADPGEIGLSGSPDAVPATTTESSADPTTTAPSTTTTSIALEYHDVGYVQFAWAGDLAVYLPVTRYETVGFHESGHDGAFQLEVVGLVDWRTLASRGRGTGSRTAADIVVPPGEAIMAPITGTVIRAGTYTLYCDHSDNFIVIEPEGRPGWELKIFHFEGLAVGVGDDVVVSETLIGSGGRILPFESQVDEFTAEPSNAHVHIEVIDTSIPDRPSSGGGC